MTRFLKLGFLLALVAHCGWAQLAVDFLDGSVLQEIRLTMAPADWQKLHDNYTDKKTNYRADFVWRGMTVQSVGVHTRGTGSLNPIKPGIGIEFDKFTAGQRFLGLQSVILRNFLEDSSTLHETLTMRVFERMGMPFQRTAHARLFVNGQYVAMYEMAEPIDSRFLITRFGDDSGYLYEAQGGQNNHFQYLGDAATPYVPTLFDPKTHTDDPQGQVIAAWVKAVNLSSEAEFVAAVSKYTDLGAFVAYAAVEVFMGEADGMFSTGGMTNFYLYRRAGDDRFFALPWDKEMTFVSSRWPIFQAVDDNVLLHRALQVPELRKRYFDTLHEASEAIGGPGGWLETELQREYLMVRDAVAQDPSRVCLVDGSSQACPLPSFEANVNAARQFAQERAAFVTAALKAEGWVESSSVPSLTLGAVMNAASGVPVLAPGMMGLLRVALPIRGTERATSWPLPTNLGGVSVTVGGIPAPMLIASETGIWFQTPSEVLSGPTSVVVTDAAGSSHAWPVEVWIASPGIFTVTHADGRSVTASDPVTAGEWIVTWATGLGRAQSDDASGQPAPVDRLVQMKNVVSATVGGVPGTVLWAGLSPGYAAMQQVVVQVPEGLSSGEWGLRLVMLGEPGGGYALPVR